MSAEKKTMTTDKKIVIAIIVVAILLILVMCLLFFRRADGTASSPGNILDGASGEKITLEGIESEEQTRFSLNNMFPGDSESRTYYIKVKDSGVKAISFRADMTSQDATLAEVLHVLVSLADDETPLYDGMLFAMPERLRAVLAEGESEATFKITVSLDTSVGNEYANKALNVNFVWWIEDADYVPSPTPDPGPVESDECCSLCQKICLWCMLGGECYDFCPWCWLIPLFLLLLIIACILYLIFKKKHDDKDDNPPAKPPIVPPPVRKPHVAVPHMPKKTHHNHHPGFAKQYEETVDLDDLMAAYAPGDTVTMESLKAKGLITPKAKGYKVLVGDHHKIDRPLHVHATRFSLQAKHAIIAAGGTATKV